MTSPTGQLGSCGAAAPCRCRRPAFTPTHLRLSSHARTAVPFRRGCRTNHRRSRLLVRLRQGDDSGVSLFSRRGPAMAACGALMRSAKTALIKFVQAVWFVRQPQAKAAVFERIAAHGSRPLLARSRRPRHPAESVAFEDASACWIRPAQQTLQDVAGTTGFSPFRALTREVGVATTPRCPSRRQSRFRTTGVHRRFTPQPRGRLTVSTNVGSAATGRGLAPPPGGAGARRGSGAPAQLVRCARQLVCRIGEDRAHQGAALS